MKKLVFILSIFLLQAIIPDKSYTIGKLYGRIPWQENSPINNLNITSFSANVNIGDQMAVTHIVQEFSNDSWYDFEGVFVFELPPDAKLTEFALWKDGERIEYDLKALDEAAEIYEEIVTRDDDPLFPENEHKNIFRLRVFPVKAMNKFKLEFSYIHILPYESGNISYLLPMDATGYTVTPIPDVDIVIDIASQFRIIDVSCPAYESLPDYSIRQLTPSIYKISYNADDVLPDKDFDIQYTMVMQSSYFNVLTYTPESTDDNYFTLWITSPDSLFQDTILVKEIVFAADLSSSMDGERLRDLKQSLIYFINQLHPVDWFNIVPFSTEVSMFRSDLVRASEEMKAAAVEYISQFSAVGLTNIEGALAQCLAHQYSHRNRRITILFTDGEPTAGIVDFSTILNNVANNNTYDVSIFSVGIGDAVDKTLLSMIAAQNTGYAFFIDSNDSLSVRLNELYPRIIVPALTDISLNYGQIQTFDVYPPHHISNMVKGMQQVIRGRYRGEGEITMQLKGNVGGTPVVLESQAAFLTNTNSHIGSLWAAGKIDYLLSLIKQHGEIQELIEAIVYLSKTYSILTPYTAFLLIQPGEGKPPSEITEAELSLKPVSYRLSQNYPNPFNPTTIIKYIIAGGNNALKAVSLKVYNCLGEEIKTLVDAEKFPGEYTVEWDATDSEGRKVASGLYYYHIRIEGFKAVKAMVFMK